MFVCAVSSSVFPGDGSGGPQRPSSRCAGTTKPQQERGPPHLTGPVALGSLPACFTRMVDVYYKLRSSVISLFILMYLISRSGEREYKFCPE
jgi:hypothetical protein